MYKAIFFDLDDTLLNFKSAEQKSLCATFSQFYGSSALEDEFQQTFRSVNKMLWKCIELGQLTPTQMRTQRFELVNEKLRANPPPHIVADFFENELVNNSSWLPGAEESVQVLKERFQIGVVTNGLSSVQRGRYKLFNFRTIASVYLISEEVGISKPDPRIFNMALKSCSLSPHEVLMVGDSLSSDFQGALNAGIDFCWINAFAAALPKELPIPSYNVRSVAELQELVGQAIV